MNGILAEYDDFALRAMAPSDLAVLAGLDRRFSWTPWSAASFQEELTLGAYCRVLARGMETPKGYCITRCLGEEWHLMNIGVVPSLRRRGWGGRLIADAMSAARAAGGSLMLLEVRAGNKPAIGLYRHMGFSQVGRRVGYYLDAAGNAEDALVLTRSLKEWTDG